MLNILNRKINNFYLDNRERYDEIIKIKMAEEGRKSTRLKRQENIEFYALKQMEELKFMELKAQEEKKLIEFKKEKENQLREEGKEAKANEETQRMRIKKQRELNKKRWDSLIYEMKGLLNDVRKLKVQCNLLLSKVTLAEMGLLGPLRNVW